MDIADSYTSASQTVNYSAPSQKVKKAVNIANYNSPNAPAAVPPKYKPSSPAKAAYKKPTYEAPAPAPAYQAPEKQTYKTSKKKPTTSGGANPGNLGSVKTNNFMVGNDP